MPYNNNLIQVHKIKKLFKRDQQQEMLVLDNVNFTLKEGEIVALLGRSGSGKSTLLRIIAGLITPSSGKVYYRGKPVTRPMRGIAMVFQNFALMPWLTVLQNVELGLEALGVKRQERRQRALKAIDTVGLDGFESAFPKELSGGMSQRVGLARAIVVNPDVLLMDEPFSALDVLTADNLRSDLLDLWMNKKTQTNGILFVTHNIEEALILADRVIIFDSNPGCVRAELPIKLPRPRDEESPAFRSLMEQIYTLMTSAPGLDTAQATPIIDLGYRLPDARVSELAGLIETIADEEGHVLDLPTLAEISYMDVDELLSLTEVLDILHFAELAEGEIHLTDEGKRFAEADILHRKEIFAKHLLQYIPLVKHICSLLAKRTGHQVSKKYFLADLEDYLSDDDAERVLRIVIEWGRYAELFAYDDNSGKLSLENPQ